MKRVMLAAIASMAILVGCKDEPKKIVTVAPPTVVVASPDPCCVNFVTSPSMAAAPKHTLKRVHIPDASRYKSFTCLDTERLVLIACQVPKRLTVLSKIDDGTNDYNVVGDDGNDGRLYCWHVTKELFCSVNVGDELECPGGWQ